MNKVSREVVRKFSHSTKRVPICANCVNFIPDNANYLWDREPDDAKYATCKKFSELNFITGKKTYEFAYVARKNACGIAGVFYEPKANL